MKNILLATLSLLLISNMAHAEGMKIKPILAYAINNATISDAQSATVSSITPKSKGGFQFGGLFFWNFASNWDIRTGVVYSQRDIDMEIVGSGFTITQNLKLTYIDIPLDVQYDFDKSGFGLYGGLLLGIKSSASCTQSLGSCTIDVTSTSTMANLGAEYSFLELGGGQLALSAEYQMGLTNVNATAGNTAKIIPNAILFGLGWKTEI